MGLAKMEKEPFDFKNFLFGSINRKLTLLFLVVAIVAPACGIGFFYAMSESLLQEESEIFLEQSELLRATAVIIIGLIAANATMIGFLASRSISKPIKKLHQMTQEIEKGNFSVRSTIKTNDEIEALSHAFNKTAMALEKMNDERLQIDKAKSEFLSITSHELRTPITPMKAQLQMLEKEYFGKLTKKQKESIIVIRRNAERLNRIIEDFLEISRIEAARLRFVFRDTNIKQTIEETTEFMKGFANEKNITLSVTAQNLPTIQADPDRISQVLRNLVHNAIKFSKENSSISIDAVQKNNIIVFSVTDHGVGMSSEDQIRVFEPFYQIEDTLDRKHGGTGLGLAICRGIVESQKGKLWVESTLGQGSTFFFTFPVDPVDEIEPIKVLFSAKDDIHKKIKTEFVQILGPMGLVEFNDLKNKHALGKNDILEYIQSLSMLKILNEKKQLEFQTSVLNIFGEETPPQKQQEEIIPYTEKRGEEKR